MSIKQKLAAPLLVALLGTLVGCGGAEPPPSPPPPPPPPPTKTVAVEAPTPEPEEPALPPLPAVEFVEGTPADAPEKMPTVKLIAPVKDQVVSIDKKGDFEVKLDVKDWPAPEGGRHVHLILDNQPYKRIDDPKQPVKLKDIAPGYELAENQQHVLVAFPSRSTHESVKPQDKKIPLAIVPFFVGKKGEIRWKATDPTLIYSRPKGANDGPPPADGILVDFYLANAELGEGKFSIEATLKGPGLEEGKTVAIASWKPWRIKNPRTGTYSLHLTLKDKDGKPVAGPFNDVTREFTVNLDAPAENHAHAAPQAAPSEGPTKIPLSRQRVRALGATRPRRVAPFFLEGASDGRRQRDRPAKVGFVSGNFVAGMIAGWVTGFVGLAILFLRAWTQRREEGEYLVFFLQTLSACVCSSAMAGLYVVSASPDWAQRWELFADLGTIGALLNMAFGLHFAVRFARPRQARVAAICAYVVCAGYVLALLLGGWWIGPPLRLEEVHTPFGAVLVAPPRPTLIGRSFYVLLAAGVPWLVVLLWRAYRAGKRESLSALIGAAVLTLSVWNDVTIGGGLRVGVYLTPLGYLCFAFGVGMTLVSRYGSLSNELEARSAELRRKTSELSASYEALQRAQDELVRKEQLAVVGELAAVIAHEVRNPLAIIGNAVAGLRKRQISEDDRTTLLQIIDEENSRLNRLVSDLLCYARPVNPQRQLISIRDSVERTLGLPLVVEQSALHVELQCETHTPSVWGDPNLLRQVFDNLIGNAVQAMNGHGTLQVRLRPEEQQSVRGVLVEIQDSGEGMDTQVRSRARTPFFTTRPSGTGLGLAIVDRIIDAHGGTMTLQSNVGEGTTVSVFLPQGRESQPPPSPVRGSSPDLTSEGFS